MTWLLAADLALLFAAATAIAVALRVPAHRPVAVFLGVVSVADGIRRGLAGELAAPGPYTGATRALFHLEQALYLLWPFGLAALAGAVFAQRRPWMLAGAYVTAVAALALSYPTVRLELLGRVYLAAELGALVVCLAAATTWAWQRERPGLAHVVALMLIAVDVAKVAAGPWRGSVFATWDRAWPMHAILYLAIGAAQGGGIAWSSSATR